MSAILYFERPLTPEANREARMMPQLPEPVIEQLAELWCDVLLANLRRHPVELPMRKAS